MSSCFGTDVPQYAVFQNPGDPTVQNSPDPLSHSHFRGPELSGVSLRTNGEAVGTGGLCGSNAMSEFNEPEPSPSLRLRRDGARDHPVSANRFCTYVPLDVPLDTARRPAWAEDEPDEAVGRVVSTPTHQARQAATSASIPELKGEISELRNPLPPPLPVLRRMPRSCQIRKLLLHLRTHTRTRRRRPGAWRDRKDRGNPPLPFSVSLP